MNSRQRVLSALEHHSHDRIPIDFGGFLSGIHKKAYLKLINYLGIEDHFEILDPIQQLANPCEELLKRFHADIRYVSLSPSYLEKSSNNYKDEFGVTWTMQDEKQNYMYISNHPLSDVDISDIENYSFPNFYDKYNFKGLREKAISISYNETYALSTSIDGSLFELCCNLRGTEKWYMDTKRNPSFCKILLNKVLEQWMRFYSELLNEIGELVDIVIIADDLAGRNGPLFSLDFYRDLLKPAQKKLIQHIKSLTKAKICYHTCGSCFEFIPDLIEIGVDILNPLQIGLKNMNPHKIKDTFGKQISLWGGSIDAYHFLAFSSPEKIRKEVQKNIEILAQGGGYIFSNTHNIQFDVPASNIVTLFDAAYEFSR